MAVTPAAEGEDRLPCGRSWEQVWDRLDDPPDEHEADCSECQRARASFRMLGDAVDQTRQVDARDLDRPRTEVRAAIMAIARRELRRGRRLALVPPGSDGSAELTVSDHALAHVVWRAADSVAEARARRVKVLPDVDPDTVAVRIELAASILVTAAIPQVVTVLRRRILSAVQRQVGIPVRSVDVTVQDAHEL